MEDTLNAIPRRLILDDVDLETGVRFTAELGDGTSRVVTVKVGAGRSWYEALRFPHLDDETGETLGSDMLDARARQRASEEIVRLAAAIGAMRVA